MKLFHKISPEVVTVNIDSNNISCAWFVTNKKNHLFVLNDYENFQIKDSIYDLDIFNFVHISNYLKSFLIRNKLENSFVYVSLNGNQVKDQLLKKDDNTNDYEEEKNLYISNVYQIHNDIKDIFYLAKIKHSLIFQYKIFAIKSQINLLKIIPGNIVSFQILKLFKPDLLKNITQINDINTNFNNFIDSYDVRNCIIFSNSKINIENEKNFLMKNLGIFLLKSIA